MKTHKVIDLVYHEEEGSDTFVGTYEECIDFVADQSFGYEICLLSHSEFIQVNS